MHIEGPWLSTTGKKKGKPKFASAEAKRKHIELEEEWQKKNKEWAKLSKPVTHIKTKQQVKMVDTKPSTHKSLNSWVTGPVSSKVVRWAWSSRPGHRWLSRLVRFWIGGHPHHLLAEARTFAGRG